MNYPNYNDSATTLNEHSSSSLILAQAHSNTHQNHVPIFDHENHLIISRILHVRPTDLQLAACPGSAYRCRQRRSATATGGKSAELWKASKDQNELYLS